MLRWALLLGILASCGRISFEPLALDGPGEGADVPNRIFISKLTTAGNFGGIAFADATCAMEAQAAGLSGTFIAFLSDLTTNARTRIASSRGWVRVDGAPVGDTDETMFDRSAIYNPVNVQADGTVLSLTSTWTGTDGTGASTENCANWTVGTMSASGDGNAVLNATFAGGNAQTCEQLRRFTCMEIGHVAPVSPHRTDGRIAFTTVADRRTAIGVVGADAICANDAAGAGLPGTYKAALATTTMTIASRFTIDSRPWVRVDGTRIAGPTELLSGAGPGPLDSFPSQYANGIYSTASLWTGVSTTPDAPSVAADTCLDWTSVAAGNTGSRGIALSANRVTMWANSSNQCDNSFHFLCLQE